MRLETKKGAKMLDAKKIEKVTKQRNASRETLKKIAQEIYNVSVANSIKMQGDKYSYKYSTAYNGCYYDVLGADNSGNYGSDSIAIFKDDKIVDITLMNEPREELTYVRDYGCYSPVAANTKEVKDWIMQQLKNINDYENIEDDYLLEIKELFEVKNEK